jgi:hypothetical protein
METKTIQSWRHKKVRVKEEYIIKEMFIDEDASTYDDDDNIIEEVYYEQEYIKSECGLGSVLSGKERDVFEVASDCYGVDLYSYHFQKFDIDTLPEPTHQIILRDNGYPFMWDSKYFEVVTTEEIYVADKEFNQ